MGRRRMRIGLAVAGLCLAALALSLVTRPPAPAIGEECAEEEVKIGIVTAKGCFKKGEDSRSGEYLENTIPSVVVNGFKLSSTDGKQVAKVRFFTGKTKDGKNDLPLWVTSNGQPVRITATEKVGNHTNEYKWLAGNGIDVHPPAKGSVPLFNGALSEPNSIYGIIPPVESKSVVQINEHGGGSFEIGFALKSFLQFLDKGVDFGVGWEVEESGEAKFEGVEGEVEGVSVAKLFEINKLALKLATSPEFSIDATAGATLKVPDRVADKGLIVTFGANSKGPTKLGLTATGLNVQIGTTGIYLQKAGLTLFAQPLGFGGQAGITAGPKMKVFGHDFAAVAVDGSIDLRAPDEQAKKHGYLDTKAALKLIGLSVANAHFRYDFGQGTQFQASVGMGIPSLTNNPSQPLYVGAWLNGWTTANGFNLEGSGRLKIFAFDLAGVSTVMSNVGVAGCIKVIAWIGGGVLWRNGQVSLLGGWSCDLGGYRGHRAAVETFNESTRSEAPLRLPKDVAVISVAGQGATPMVKLEHEDGRMLQTPPVDDADGLLQSEHGAAIAEHEGGDSVHFLPEESAGQWTVSSLDGSPVDVSSIRTASTLPDHNVKAEIRGTGLKRKLVWRAREIPHQSLVFSEVLPNGSEVGLFRTNRPRGSRQIQLAHGGDSYGARKLAVDVRQRFDTPRDELIADRYRVTRPKRPGTPAKVKAVRMLHDVVVSWRGVKGAQGYEIVARDPSGLQMVRSVGPRARKVRLDSVQTRRKLNIGVAAVNVDGAAGKPRRTSIDTHRLVGGPKRALRDMLRDARRNSSASRVVAYPECPHLGSCIFRLGAERGGRRIGHGVAYVGPDMTDRISFKARRPGKATLRGSLTYKGRTYEASVRPR